MSCIAAISFVIVAGLVVWRNRASIPKIFKKPKFQRLQLRHSAHVPSEKKEGLMIENSDNVYDVINEKCMIADLKR